MAKQNDFDASICVQDAEFGKRAQWQFFLVANFSHFVKNILKTLKYSVAKSRLLEKNWPKVTTFTLPYKRVVKIFYFHILNIIKYC